MPEGFARLSGKSVLPPPRFQISGDWVSLFREQPQASNRMLFSLWPAAVSPDSWWMLLPLPVIAAGVYAATLAAAGPIFTARREMLLAEIEGKDYVWKRSVSPIAS